MNTADRFIARVDTAMRRRFGFVELHPRTPPVPGLLARWLDKKGLPSWPAQLLDALNARIEDADAAIGPSYLMDERIYKRDDGVAVGAAGVEGAPASESQPSANSGEP